MEANLERASRRAAVLGVALAVAAVVISQAGTLWLASHRTSSEQADVVESGVALTPGDAEAWDRLGRLQQWDMEKGGPSQAMAAYQRAVRVNPLWAHYWLDLASADEDAGNPAAARQAFARARDVYPASAEVAFYYGNFLLRQGEYDEAYKALSRAVSSDPRLLPLAISRAWRANGDVHALLNRMLPRDANAYFEALDFFSTIHEAEPALVIWHSLVALGQPIALPHTFPLFEELIREDRAEEARRTWQEARRAASLFRQDAANGSLVWNGDFREDFAEGGLDWRWNMPLGATIDFDNAPAPNGSRAIRLEFGGGSNIGLDAPFEYVPVQPNRTYHFRGYLRTAEITTESGIRFQITDPNHNGAVSMLTDDFAGTRPWTAVEADVTTGSETHFLLIRVARLPSRLFENRLSGTAWVADVSLIPHTPASGQASR